MAKKVVASLKKETTGKSFTKVIKMVRSPKTGAYNYKEAMVMNDDVKEFFSKK